MSKIAYTYVTADGHGPFESPQFDSKNDAELFAASVRQEPRDWHDYDDNGNPVAPVERIEIADNLVQAPAPTGDGTTDAPTTVAPEGIGAGEGTPPTA